MMTQEKDENSLSFDQTLINENKTAFVAVAVCTDHSQNTTYNLKQQYVNFSAFFLPVFFLMAQNNFFMIH